MQQAPQAAGRFRRWRGMDTDAAPEADLAKESSAKPATAAVRLAVCVNTYLRPEGLDRLLRALALATFPT